MLLQKMKWPEVKEELGKGTVVIVPVGSTEQHGYHLPIDTDVAATCYIACQAAERERAIVAPPVNYGYNEKELAFPGTVSVRAETLIQFLFDICHSLSRTGFKRILLLNGHGFNTFLVVTVSHMVNERTDSLCAATSYWQLIDKDLLRNVRESKTPGGMAHACEFETSLQLFLDPGHVDMSKAVKEMSFYETRYTFFDLIEVPPVMIRTNWDKNSRSGVIGDPTLATREKGEKLVNAAIEGLAEFFAVV
jgi:creatinine amidohydrolase